MSETYISDEALLTMLERNLELITDFMDAEAKASKETELMTYINASKGFIEREGITLQDTIDDAMLITMYSSWLYQRRMSVSTGEFATNAMPRALRYNLNNRVFQEKVND